MLAILLLIAWLSRRGIATRLWRGIIQQRMALAFFCGVLLFIVAISTFLVRNQSANAIQRREAADYNTPSNLISTGPLPVVPLTTTVLPIEPHLGGTEGEANTRDATSLPPQSLVAGNVVIVQPGADYRLSLLASSVAITPTRGSLQLRELWFDPSLKLILFKDSPALQVDPLIAFTPPDAAGNFITAVYQAPPGATRLQIEVRNAGTTELALHRVKLSQQGVYIEPHPNGTQGAIAFSLDWETAMGGAIHSQGMAVHDPAAAAEHGLRMREGADWLNRLFTGHNIHASFYATGYNLLDGNTERRTFSGNPTYKWAKPKNNWSSDYWLTHPWFSDDPYGTDETDPAWYFSDQTRALLQAGHEIAPHTFAHIYVRGSNPEELATDMDEWINAAKAQAVPPPTTFAFPWRSSNSLTADFYDTLYSKGIRAVTRIYALDMHDLFTLGAVPASNYMPVMPDFLLGSPSSNAGEEAGGAVIGLQRGLDVLQETLARRGTTSFWTHPEQLGNSPQLEPEKEAWRGVVEEAARQRDNGRLWINTVANITAYQRNVMSVTVTLNKPGSGPWHMVVTNNAGRDLQGVTFTLPGDAARLTSTDAEILTVQHADTGTIHLSSAAQPVYPARQLVISTLKPGVTTVDIEWEKDQEPLQ